MQSINWNFENSYLELPKIFYTRINPTPVKFPRLIVFNDSLAKDLGLNIKEDDHEYLTEVFSGNRVPLGSEPIAQAYAGHQFGHFTILGDGRAILLGELITPDSDRYDIQLKGSGRTPYSRNGDGRASIGPMLREYIISEAMHGLGIPTTRSLAVVTTGEDIYRSTPETGAIVTRVSKSHIRVGTFEYAAHKGSFEDLKSLADYTINRHYPSCFETDNPYRAFLEEVVKRQALLVAKWMSVGFIHGVMNTDNITISGETIDFGPCAFMDVYNPKTVFSSIDTGGRYAYGNQPQMTAWGLARFAEAIIPLIDNDKDKAVTIAQDIITGFGFIYHSHWLKFMSAKIGIVEPVSEDGLLINELLDIMYNNKSDFTNTFLNLREHSYDGCMYMSKAFKEWELKWKARLDIQGLPENEVLNIMERNTPVIIPRNYRVEEALSGAVDRGDYSKLNELVAVLRTPYEYDKSKREYIKLPPENDVPYRTFCGT